MKLSLGPKRICSDLWEIVCRRIRFAYGYETSRRSTRIIYSPKNIRLLLMECRTDRIHGCKNDCHLHAQLNQWRQLCNVHAIDSRFDARHLPNEDSKLSPQTKTKRISYWHLTETNWRRFSGRACILFVLLSITDENLFATHSNGSKSKSSSFIQLLDVFLRITKIIPRIAHACAWSKQNGTRHLNE